MKFLLTLTTLFLISCSPQGEKPFPEVNSNLQNAKSGSFSGSGDFGVVSATDTSVKINSYVLTNNGSEILTGMAQIDNNVFSLVYTNCPATLAVKKSCTIKVSFNPKSVIAGAYSANLTYDSFSLPLTVIKEAELDNNESALAEFQISSVAVTTVNFGEISQKQSVVKNIYVKNKSQITITRNITLSNNKFVVNYDSCSGKPIVKGGSCLVKVSMSGVGQEGDLQSTLSYGSINLELTGKVISPLIADSDPNSTLKPTIVFLENSIEIVEKIFSPISGNQNIQAILYIKNTGSLATTTTTAALSDTNNFKISYNACSNLVLGTNKSCQVRVLFSATGKNPGDYNTNLVFGNKILPITAKVLGPIVVTTYQAGYTSFGACSAMACEGSGISTRILNRCDQYNNGTLIGPTDLNNCAAFNIESYLQQPCLSPEGDKTFTIENGSQVKHCLTGSTEPIETVSTNCNPGYHNVNNSCVEDIISFVPIYSEYGSCSVSQPCEGNGYSSRSLTGCQKYRNGQPEEGGQLSDCAVYDTVGYLQEPCNSPEGTKNIAIDNGFEQVSCEVGSTTPNFISRTCDPLYFDNNSSCQLITYKAQWDEPQNNLTVCEGTQVITKNMIGCFQEHDNVQVDNTYCSSIIAPTIEFKSPVGEVEPIGISGGLLYKSCAEGSAEQINARVECNSDRYDNGNFECLEITYSVQWSDPTNNLQPCQGTQTFNKLLTRCFQDHNNLSVNPSFCSAIPIPTITYSSPAGFKYPIAIDNGVEINYCALGSSTEIFAARNCNISIAFNTGRNCELWGQESGTLMPMADIPQTDNLQILDESVESLSLLSSGKVVFSKNSINNGSGGSSRGLYVATLGTQNSTTLLKSGLPSGKTFFPVNNGARYIFIINTGSGEGDEFWTTDGTSSGTFKTKSLVSGNNLTLQATSVESNWTTDGTVYYFSVQEKNSSGTVVAHGIVKTDGTTAGTSYVPIPGSAVGTPINLGMFGTGKIVLCGNSSTLYPNTGRGHLVFNGTSYSALYTGSGGSSSDLTSSYCSNTTNQKESFNFGTVTAFVRTTGNYGAEWVLYNSSTSAFVAEPDMYPGSGTNSGVIDEYSKANPNIVVMGSTLYFVGTKGDTVGKELYSLSTTGTITLVKDINTNANASSNPRYLTVFNSKLYFFASDGTNTRLWTSTGAAGNGAVVANQTSSTGTIGFMKVFNNRLYFPMTTSTSGTELCSINTSDVISCFEMAPGSSSGISSSALLRSVVVGSSAMYIIGSDGTKNSLYRVTSSNVLEKVLATEAGSLTFNDASPTNKIIPQAVVANSSYVAFASQIPENYKSGSMHLGVATATATESSNVYYERSLYEDYNVMGAEVAVFGGVGFSANLDINKGQEFYISKKDNSYILDNIIGSGGASVTSITEYNEQILFNQNGKLYSTIDGTTSSFIDNFTATAMNSLFSLGNNGYNYNPDKLLLSGGLATDSSTIGSELYSLDQNSLSLLVNYSPDGVSAQDISNCSQYTNSFSCGFGSIVYSCSWSNSKCNYTGTGVKSSKIQYGIKNGQYSYFIVNKVNGALNTQNDLIRINNDDLSYTTIFSNLGTNISNFDSAQGNVYFLAGGMVYKIDNNGSLSSISNSSLSANNQLVALDNGKVVFTCGDPKQICVTSGTSASSQVLTGGTLLNQSLTLSAVKDSNGNKNLILFFKETLVYGLEIWRTDGTVSGTDMVDDFFPLSLGFILQPDTIPAVSGRNIYFLAYTIFTGWELWTSDGTSSGTKLLTESINGADSRFLTNRNPISVSGGGIFILGYDNDKKLKYYRYRP